MPKLLNIVVFKVGEVQHGLRGGYVVLALAKNFSERKVLRQRTIVSILPAH
jgi:hypothetical protein